MALKPGYDTFKRTLKAIVRDMQVLAGDQVGPSKATWQDVAGTLAINLELYAELLNRARKGDAEPFLSFPSIDEIIEEEGK